ncbi:ComF family protein [Xylocopilactobacillus apicola]|uniref:Competence protein n=1 Tax=Xylocopilactobacillus apicola TaxID=2932184 RepID=A0AAU9D6F4_9LACO|nr:hypothetical protein [Xylocopilactobacillus apicola]BDR57941.1 competence protein [Xylocopilactobacillus apicola]
MTKCLLCQAEIVPRVDLQLLLTFKKIYPPTICDRCLKSFVRLNQQHCPQCGRIQEKSVLCLDCQKWRQIYGSDIVVNQALFAYDTQMHDYFQAFKKMGDYRLRSVFLGEIAEWLRKQPQAANILVPTGKSHLAERKFDPVMAIFGDLIPVTSKMDNILEVEHQSLKNRRQRLQTEQTFYFSAENASKLQDFSLIRIFDDIYTTGATIYRMRDALREQNIKKPIVSFTLAR